MGIWPDWTWADVSVDIKPYVISGYWYDGVEWRTLSDSHVMIAGQEYVITVSQDCTLSWLGYRFNLVTGSNTIVWEPTEDIVAVIPLTLVTPSVDDVVATIPLTLTVPTIELPPEEDWWANISEWLTENWYMAVAAIVIFLIGIFVWARYK